MWTRTDGYEVYRAPTKSRLFRMIREMDRPSLIIVTLAFLLKSSIGLAL